MFTGIVTDVGTLRSSESRDASLRIHVACAYGDLQLGESVAVDGVCLTVTNVGGGAFVADVSRETLARTTLGRKRNGDRVNLERALAAGDRMGGHIVAGHVDGAAEIAMIDRVGEMRQWTVHAAHELMRFVAEKGSIAIDGVSLTVNSVGPTSFTLMLVPFTLAATTFADKSPGNAVNLEVDVVARYVARLMDTRDAVDGVGVDLLRRAGFLDR